MSILQAYPSVSPGVSSMELNVVIGYCLCFLESLDSSSGCKLLLLQKAACFGPASHNIEL